MTEQKAYAIVTGASSGIGYQYARVLAEKGYNLLIISNINLFKLELISKFRIVKSFYSLR